MKKTSITLLFLFILFAGYSSELDSLFKYKPHIEGTIRAKYEYNTSIDGHRFQLRNARFSVFGKFSPLTSYKAEIDLSDEGETKMLDAYVRMQPWKWINLTIGQQKIPFSTDNLRSPNKLYFANRSFIGKQITGLRDVGATLMLNNENKIPYSFQVGVYNGEGLYNQQEWKKNLSVASRFEIFPIKELEMSLNFNSIKPENIRMNFYDVGAYLQTNGLHLEAEYVYKTYENDVFPVTKAFSIFGNYDIYLDKGVLKKISPLIRFDGMSDNNKGLLNSSNSYGVDHVSRKRFTSGLTFSFDKPFLNDIRLNYEQYFYEKDIVNKENKLVIEFVVKFN